MSFEIVSTWLPVSDLKSSETDATLCKMTIKIDGKNVTAFKDDRGSVSHEIEIPSFYLAEWIAENWWPLLWEPRKTEDGDDSADFISRHSFLAAQHGFALPRVSIVPTGRSVQVSASSRNVEIADVRFLHGGSTAMPRESVESELRTFVSSVVDRLTEARFQETYLQDAWQLISETGPDEVQFCQFAGALGLSPYDISDGMAALIDRLLPTLGERLLMDLCLASPASTFSTTALLAEKAVSLTKDASISTLAPLNSLSAPKDNVSLPAHRRGVQAAQVLRRKFGIKETDVQGASRIFDMLHVDTGFRVQQMPKNEDEVSITGAVVRDESEMRVALLQAAETKRRFTGARAIFSAWSSETDNESRLLTSALTRDQQANRAFAAELTAPLALIRARAPKRVLTQNALYDLAGDLKIGLDVIKNQALNNGLQVSPT